jgi:CHAT domain-containing protein
MLVPQRLVSQPADGRRRPRLWWCPTGNFVYLPIHAAGDGTASCTDYVVSSYTPTLGALLATRHSLNQVSRRTIKSVLSATPRTNDGEWAELPSTIEEFKAVASMLPPGSQIPIPSEDDVTAGPGHGMRIDTLLNLLPETAILHLACHGIQNLENPLDSGFVLRDGILTISRLMEKPLPNAFLAFLSACETAKGDEVCTRS